MITIPYGKTHIEASFHYDGLLTSRVDQLRSDKTGLELVEAPVASTTGSFARHDPDQLARVLLEIYRHRVVRIFRGERRYILEE